MGRYCTKSISTMGLCDIKCFVLALLVIQNTCFVILVRYTRTRPGVMYLSSSAVCCDEAIKLITCFGILTLTYLFKKRGKGDGDGGGEYSQVTREEINGESGGLELEGIASDEEDVADKDDVNTTLFKRHEESDRDGDGEYSQLVTTDITGMSDSLEGNAGDEEDVIHKNDTAQLINKHE